MVYMDQMVINQELEKYDSLTRKLNITNILTTVSAALTCIGTIMFIMNFYIHPGAPEAQKIACNIGMWVMTIAGILAIGFSITSIVIAIIRSNKKHNLGNSIKRAKIKLNGAILILVWTWPILVPLIVLLFIGYYYGLFLSQ